MGILVCLICMGISIYLIFLSSLRAYDISKLDTNLNKNKELKSIRIFSFIALIGIVLGFISLIFLSGIFQVAIPAITIFIVSAGINRILAETEKQDAVKQDYEILEEFLKEAEKDAKEKSKK